MIRFSLSLDSMSCSSEWSRAVAWWGSLQGVCIFFCKRHLTDEIRKIKLAKLHRDGVSGLRMDIGSLAFRLGQVWLGFNVPKYAQPGRYCWNIKEEFYDCDHNSKLYAGTLLILRKLQRHTDSLCWRHQNYIYIVSQAWYEIWSCWHCCWVRGWRFND